MDPAFATMLAEFLKTVRPFTDPAFAEIGEFIASKVRFANQRAAIRAAQRALDLLREAGLEPGPIPPKILLPSLEGAALESEEQMHDRWAHLLANTSAGQAIHPGFVSILRELTADDVRVLDWLARDAWHDSAESRGVPCIYSVRTALGWTEFHMALIIDNLRRHRLLGLSTMGMSDDVHAEYLSIDDERPVVLTIFGETFIRACTTVLPKVSEIHG